MLAVRFEIRNPSGLHTRPGTNFVRLAKTFTCDISIRKGDGTVNAKSLVKLLKIGISQGDVIELTCDGADEEQAFVALDRFLQDLDE